MSFTCPRCSMTSHHPMDEDYGYCGKCHAFTGQPKKAPPSIDTNEAELQFWFDMHQASDQMALAQWRAAHPVSELMIPDHADLVIWLLDQLAGLNRIERTPTGMIDWKMEAERANRLLDSYERKYSVEQIPCDVMLPPATVIHRGCDLGTLMTGLKAREGYSPEDTSFHPEIAERLDRVDSALAKRVGAMIVQHSALRVWLAEWLRCYALDIFPEPDLAKAAEVLKAHGMTIDSLSANMGRHILTRVIAKLDDPEADE